MKIEKHIIREVSKSCSNSQVQLKIEYLLKTCYLAKEQRAKKNWLKFQASNFHMIEFNLIFQ